MRILLITLVAAAGAAALAGPARAAPGPAPQCFRINDWNGWRPVDEKTINVGVGVSTVYQVGFSAPCRRVLDPGVHLVTKSVNAASLICYPVDLDIRVGDQTGFSTACIVSSIRRLTPEEVKALPKKQIP